MVVTALVHFVFDILRLFRVYVLVDLPTVTFPAGVSFDAPVPLLSAAQVYLLNAWALVAVTVGLAVGLTRALVWLYKLIPFN